MQHLINEDPHHPVEKKEFREAPPPKVNPWTKKLNSVTVNGQTAPEQTGPAKVVRAGNPRSRRGGKVGDFGDATNWPTPGEIATKEVQGCKKASVKKESKEKRDSEETKENQKTKSDDSGEEKNREEDAHKNSSKVELECDYIYLIK
ncbi:la-related protein 1-like isoform X2 [Hemibagrus wyckioides]|uniref:la-related protein 1-like isoform X2 n=1 Tax=Hemibagrus wyckioides TaxID=337641 RepID=UPI00266CF327|nr:la-related protein 1-like isoform X2 [Hemibagrus wyckioides]